MSGASCVRHVNGTPKLTPWRHLNLDPLSVLLIFGWVSGMSVPVLAGAGRDASEVAVLESIAVAFEGENLRMVY